MAAPSPTTRARVLAALAAERPTWLAFVRRRIADPAIAEDVVQETLARATEKLDTLQDPEAAEAWFYRSLRNAVADHYRRSGTAERALERLAPELEHDEQLQLADNPCACVKGVIERLPLSYGEAIRRVYGDGVSLESYATEVGITRNNAAVRLHRARNVLRDKITECCGKCADGNCRDCTCDHSSDATD